MKRIILAAAGAAILAGLAGCSSSASADTGQTPEATAITESGCLNGKPTDTTELYVRSLYKCDGFDLYIYNTSSARDSWLKIATEFGTVELKRGDAWLAVKA